MGTANRLHVAAFVKELATRPSRRGGDVVALDSGAGLANATLHQRLVPVRQFCGFLIEKGLREPHPVGAAAHSDARPGPRRMTATATRPDRGTRSSRVHSSYL
ncbi:hypothetical protein [Streptomyces sp. MP131-18]|uniref:hypothetical protein n=1 Tax=Streptomyces sp. MP131-18 TaxID=1857892 RepID=UPI0009CA7650|nr:hypothetical protein [Streptomyces sp. MP131-18]ONK15111.1 hypothetical protein STBA_59250 [Streptomyces sp. MP131-18]